MLSRDDGCSYALTTNHSNHMITTNNNTTNLKQIAGDFSQGNRVYAADGLAVTQQVQAGGLGAKTGLYAVPVLTPNRAEKRQNGRRFF